jgi:murein tripeptide amidase MpaA
MAYLLNISEIDSALKALAKTHPDLCTLIALPQLTWEGRTVNAARIARTYDTSRAAMLVLCGVHAREWGGPDIGIAFVTDLLAAYSAKKGLQYGDATFTATQIATLIDSGTIYVVPCANPDGVNYSQTKEPGWRKNRSPKSYDGTNDDTHGVDLNRNYDFLWDFKTSFTSNHDDQLASDDPASEYFHGPAPFSEPETRNVKWLFDNFPAISIFVDVHSWGGNVIYPWGTANNYNQSFDPTESFQNPVWDHHRGNDKYAEYMEAADETFVEDTAQAAVDAMRAASKLPYTKLYGGNYYLTSGASDDYAMSRSYANPSVPKVYGFTIEFDFETTYAKPQYNSDHTPFTAPADPDILAGAIKTVVPALITFGLLRPVNPASYSGFHRRPLIVVTKGKGLEIVNPMTGQTWTIGFDGSVHVGPRPTPVAESIRSRLAMLAHSAERHGADLEQIRLEIATVLGTQFTRG